jgi:hypothetical protein
VAVYQATAVNTAAASRNPPWFLSGWDIRVGVFPEGEEILVGGLCLRSIPRHCLGGSEYKVSHGSERIVNHGAAVRIAVEPPSRLIIC